jgi:hypothetical protein
MNFTLELYRQDTFSKTFLVFEPFSAGLAFKIFKSAKCLTKIFPKVYTKKVLFFNFYTGGVKNVDL